MLSISPSASSALEQAASGSSPERSAPIAQARASKERSSARLLLRVPDHGAVGDVRLAGIKKLFNRAFESVHALAGARRYADRFSVKCSDKFFILRAHHAREIVLIEHRDRQARRMIFHEIARENLFLIGKRVGEIVDEKNKRR